jgi:phosphopantothenoylcysteine decarboxylase/phosphopantothenate--cysteine ligase
VLKEDAMKKCILLGVTGSIAAYKACELARMFVKKEIFDLHILMTEAATEFVSPLTFQTLSRNPVALNLFDEPLEWSPGHISLAERAELFIIAPCTANVIAKLAHGIADDMLTSTALASTAPMLIAPAMNSGMWANPATRDNIALLQSRGVSLVDPESGDLACGTTGCGRMAEPQTIYDITLETLGIKA